MFGNGDLPEWVDKAAWAGYVEMRKLKKAPMTERAKRMVLRKLEDFRDRGLDPNAILDQSTLRSWTDVYATNEITAERTSATGKAHMSADDIAHYKKLGFLQ